MEMVRRKDEAYEDDEEANNYIVILQKIFVSNPPVLCQNIGSCLITNLLWNINEDSLQFWQHYNNSHGVSPGYRMVWFHPHGKADISSQARLTEIHRISFYSDNDNKFVVHEKDG